MKTSVLESLFNKIAGLQACNFIKKRIQNICKDCEISKKTCFQEHLQMAASGNNASLHD